MAEITRMTTGYADFGPCDVCGVPATAVYYRPRRDGQTERHPRCSRHPFLTEEKRQQKQLRDKYRQGRKTYG